MLFSPDCVFFTRRKTMVFFFAFLFALSSCCAGMGRAFAFGAGTAADMPDNGKSGVKISSDVRVGPDGFADVLVTFADSAPDRRISQARAELTPNAPMAAIALRAASLRADAAQKQALQILAGNPGVKSFEQLKIANTINLKARPDVLNALARLEQVRSVSPNRSVHPVKPAKTRRAAVGSPRSAEFDESAEVEENIKAIRADKVWDMRKIDGKGVTIGLIDQGVDFSHPALKTHFRGYDPKTGNIELKGNYLDLVGSGNTDTHGTHVAGIMVGSEPRMRGNTEVRVNRIGVAPGAKFIAVRAFRDGVGGSNANIIKACRWMLAPGGDPGKAPKIINQSWSDGTDKPDPWLEEVSKTIREAGILNVFSAGNSGAVKAVPGSVDNPGSMPGVLSVGAVDNDGRLADFSRRGPGKWPGAELKPDLTAPGVHIRSSLPGGRYASWDGTSGAAPHVSGVAALALQANPNLSVAQLEDLLKKNTRGGTDENYPSKPNFGYGYGVTDALDTVNAALRAAGKLPEAKTGTLSGKVSVKAAAPAEIKADVDIPARAYVRRSLPVSVELGDSADIKTLTLVLLQGGTKAAEQKVSVGKNGSAFYKIAIPGDKITRAGNYRLSVQAQTTSGDTYTTEEVPVTVKESVKPGEYFTDFEQREAGIDTEGDFGIGTVNLQADPKPASGSEILGLNLNRLGMGNAPQSTFELPAIDLTGIKASDKAELVFDENASWSGGVIGFQALGVPKAPEEKALEVFNYPTKLQQNGWVQRRIDLSRFAGKTIDLFGFSIVGGGVSGEGWSVDNLRLELNGKTLKANTEPAPRRIGKMTAVSALSSGLKPVLAGISIPSLGLNAKTDGKTGAFAFSSLPVGKYDVYLGAQGFVTQKHTIEVNADTEEKLDVVLEKDASLPAPPPSSGSEDGAGSVPSEGESGMREIGYDNNNPLAGGIIHAKTGNAVAVDVTGGADCELGAVRIFGAGNNPYLRSGKMELRIKAVNALGRIIDVAKPRMITVKTGVWNQIDLSGEKIRGNRKLYVTVKQILPGGRTPAVALDGSVRPSTSAVSHAYLFNGEFVPLKSAGYFGMPMIRAVFKTNNPQDKALFPAAPKFAPQIGTAPVPDPLISDEQQPKDLTDVGEWQISPSRGVITKWYKLGEFLAKPANEQILEVPGEIGGVKITGIGAGVFKNPARGVKNVAEVRIPEGVTEINAEAFFNLGVGKISFPQSLERIYAGAFQNAKVKELVLPGNLRYIGEDAFAYSRKIEKLDIPDSVEFIGRSAFDEAEALTFLKLPRNPKFTEISALTFHSAGKLTEVEIPASVRMIKAGAFDKGFSFDESGITRLVLHEGLGSIQDNAFKGNKISVLRIPDSVEEIADSAFENNKINSLVLGTSLRTIGSSAFETNELKEVVLPDRTESVGRRAFADNPLNLVRFGRSLMPYDKSKKKGIREYALPDTLGKLEIYRAEQVNDKFKESLASDSGLKTQITVLDGKVKTFTDAETGIKAEIGSSNIAEGVKPKISVLAQDGEQVKSLIAGLAPDGRRISVLRAVSVQMVDANGKKADWQGTLRVFLPVSQAGARIYTRPLGSGDRWTLRSSAEQNADAVSDRSAADPSAPAGGVSVELSAASEIAAVHEDASAPDLPGEIDYGYRLPFIPPFSVPLPPDTNPGGESGHSSDSVTPGAGSVSPAGTPGESFAHTPKGGSDKVLLSAGNRARRLSRTGAALPLTCLYAFSVLLGASVCVRRREKMRRRRIVGSI